MRDTKPAFNASRAKGTRRGGHKSPRVTISFEQPMFDEINDHAESAQLTFAEAVRSLISYAFEKLEHEEMETKAGLEPASSDLQSGTVTTPVTSSEDIDRRKWPHTHIQQIGNGKWIWIDEAGCSSDEQFDTEKEALTELLRYAESLG